MAKNDTKTASTKGTSTKSPVVKDDTVVKAEEPKKEAVSKTTEEPAVAGDTTVKAEEPKKEEKAEEPKKEEKVEEPKKETVKKAPAKKPVKKPAVKKKEVEKVEEIYVQFQAMEFTTKDVMEKAKQAFVAEGHRESSIKSIRLYIKPEESMAYYVINDKFAGGVSL